MGAQIHLTHGQTAPVQINRPHRPLQAIDYALPIASAQLKSAILLAGLSAEGTTRLLGQIKSRDHTERLLAHFGVRVNQSLNQEGFCESISIQGGQKLEGTEIKVPGDISSAAFWLGLGAMIPCGTIEIHDVLLNPTRTGIIRLLQRMGTSIQFKITSSEPEPSGWIKIEKSDLRGVEIEPSEVPFLIDEIPLIAVLAALAKGTTIVRGAEELRVKETDRLEAVAKNLRAMGGRIELLPDGFIIEGPQSLQGARLESFGDHRIAMAFSIAALAAKGLTEIQESDCVSISYPEFYETLNSVLSQSSSSGDITILDS
jgi:3-phosphoshikimate 1-carboxyvinyltransferase